MVGGRGVAEGGNNEVRTELYVYDNTSTGETRQGKRGGEGRGEREHRAMVLI